MQSKLLAKVLATTVTTFFLGSTLSEAHAATIDYNATCYAAPNNSADNIARTVSPASRAELEAAYDTLYHTAQCRWLVYRSGSYQVGGFALIPRNLEQKAPVIIYNRAGHGATDAVSFRHIVRNLTPLVEAGFIVVGTQYRGGGGVFSGMSNGVDEYGGGEVSDVLALTDVAEQVANADLSRVGLYGVNRGTMMNMMAARDNQNVRAIVNISTISDVQEWLQFLGTEDPAPARYIPELVQCREYPNSTTAECLEQSSVQQALAQRSVMYWLDELPGHIAIKMIHGGRNWQIPQDQAEQLANALDARGQTHDLDLYPFGSNNLSQYRDAINRKVVEWFSTHL